MVDSPRSDWGWERGSEATESLGPEAPSFPEESSESSGLSRNTSSVLGNAINRVDNRIRRLEELVAAPQTTVRELSLRVQRLDTEWRLVVPLLLVIAAGCAFALWRNGFMS